MLAVAYFINNLKIKKMKILTASILLCVLLFWLFVFSFHIEEKCGSPIYKKFVVESDCNLKLPTQYFLVKDSVTNKYAILFLHFDRFRHFIKVRRYSIISNSYSNMVDANDATTFDDSCKAKGFFKMYILKKNEYNSDRFK
jgi:hypothetical protein